VLVVGVDESPHQVSQHRVFRKISSHANEVLWERHLEQLIILFSKAKEFLALKYPDAIIQHLLIWFSFYKDLFETKCVGSKKILYVKIKVIVI
jgi:hypothetical protein